ncbi:hypothetical protein [Rhizobium sp.]|jgi:hypothetical protein|uniref:hypothetical protein n=1 Tax=Rhizobium sp. TaxID=391 RepID=UPI000E86E65E|nr:hypothetical protein [Rhizobium sp.]
MQIPLIFSPDQAEMTHSKKRRNSAYAATLATAILLTGLGAAPANAGQSELSKILFGTTYDDNVTVVDAGHPVHHQDRGIPPTVVYATPDRIRTAQAEVGNNPALRTALQKRNIRVHNVLWVQTALNGGTVVYYK